MDERQLIRDAQTGDAEAMEQLLASHESVVYRLVARFFPDKSDAEDVAQDVLVRLYRRLGDFAWRSSFSTWVYRITVNMCLDEARRRKTREQPGLPEQVASPGDSPEERAMRSETCRQVQQAVSAMRPEQRAILLLREVEGLDYSEIGVVMGLAAGTVKSKLNRAREAFRRHFLNVTERGESDGMQQGHRPVLSVARR